MKEKPIKSFKEFWPFYLNEHSKRTTRAIHLAGTASAIGLLGAAAITGQWWLPVAAIGAGYGSAWTAHAFIEKNKPATFTYPLWSLMGDFKMLGHFLTGTLHKEVEKHVTKKPETLPVAQSAPRKSLLQRVQGLKTSFAKAIGMNSSKPKPASPQPPAPAP